MPACPDGRFPPLLLLLYGGWAARRLLGMPLCRRLSRRQGASPFLVAWARGKKRGQVEMRTLRYTTITRYPRAVGKQATRVPARDTDGRKGHPYTETPSLRPNPPRTKGARRRAYAEPRYRAPKELMTYETDHRPASRAKAYPARMSCPAFPGKEQPARWQTCATEEAHLRLQGSTPVIPKHPESVAYCRTFSARGVACAGFSLYLRVRSRRRGMDDRRNTSL